MKLSSRGQTNITAAYAATTMWESITNQDSFSSQQPTSVRVLCNSLYASSLSRVGRDEDALAVHEVSLLSIRQDDSFNDPIEIDVRIARGQALQRLMRYEEASSQFLAAFQLGKRCTGTEESLKERLASCLYSAVLCCLRRGDLEAANTILSSEVQMDRLISLDNVDANIIGLCGVVRWELYHRNKDTEKQSSSDQFSLSLTPLQLLQHAAESENASPVYAWFFAVASVSNCNIFKGGVSSLDNETLLLIASINQSPFDDPGLINLDDKIMLHDLLSDSGNGSEQWPPGFVLPRDEAAMMEFSKNTLETRWIMKERAGYGSHGNKIVEFHGIKSYLERRQNDKPILCQRLIEPSMLYNGRKFSIRVYVVYIERSLQTDCSNVFLLKQGLAKLAESVYESSSSTDKIFMTNSGRIEGDRMIQYDFESLKEFMKKEHDDEAFPKMWNDVINSVTNVMRFYFQSDCRNSPGTLLFSTVPKIMGFDYILDANLTPWLMEVNRFPGMEARGVVDTKVKNHVVETAWRLASLSAKTSCGLIPGDYGVHSTTTHELGIRDLCLEITL